MQWLIRCPPQTAPKRRIQKNSRLFSWGVASGPGFSCWFWSFYFAWYGTGFFTLRNSQNILVNIVSIVLMGLGQTFVIISGGIDLSVGWVMGMSSVVSAKTIRDSYNAGVDPSWLF